MSEHPRGFPPPVSIRIPVDLVARAEALVPLLVAAAPGTRATPSSVYVACIRAGLAELERQHASKKKKPAAKKTRTRAA